MMTLMLISTKTTNHRNYLVLTVLKLIQLLNNFQMNLPKVLILTKNCLYKKIK